MRQGVKLFSPSRNTFALSYQVISVVELILTGWLLCGSFGGRQGQLAGGGNRAVIRLHYEAGD
jgi:hypothetical protein